MIEKINLQNSTKYQKKLVADYTACCDENIYKPLMMSILFTSIHSSCGSVEL